MKQKINLATSGVRTLVTVSVSFLAIIRGMSAADLETQVLSSQSTSTIPHRAMQSSQPFINNSQLSELASQSSKGATQKAENLALLNEPTCEALPPVKIPAPKIMVSGSQGGAD